jgi:hypothetical protein
LSKYIVHIECWRGRGKNKRRGWREKDKLEMLLMIWKEKKLNTYCVSVLKNVLAKEVSASSALCI